MGILLNSNEKTLFDSLNVEVLRLAGTDTPVLWKFSKTGNATLATIMQVSGIVDCLYEEPRIPSSLPAGSKLKPYTPYNVLCYFEQPDDTFEATEDGLNRRIEGRIYFSRKNLEDAKVPLDDIGNHVTVGDIVQLWSKSKSPIPWYFEVISLVRDGFENDSTVWTQYVAEVVRNESFAPEQKI